MSYLFPNKCVACGKLIEDGVSVCEECRKLLFRITGTRCIRCGCEIHSCVCTGKKLNYLRNTSVFRYDGTAGSIVKRFKMGKLTQTAVYICDEMSKLIKEQYDDTEFDCITYVPSSGYRRLSRGFDHARLIADGLSARLGVKNKRLLKCRFFVPPQKSRSAKERHANVSSKFKAVSRASGMRVLLIDDVITTGSTLNECARVLRSAGAAEVLCATFAITYKK